MKYAISMLSISILMQNSFAIDSAEHRDGPCIKIMEACKTAGYNKASGAGKKSLSKDCIQPLLNGQKIEGISINQSDIDACKLKKNELKSKK